MEYIDIVDDQGNPTGEKVERSIAHSQGIRHRTAHIWIVRKVNGRYQVLMQKRAMNKESFPGMFDTHQRDISRQVMSLWNRHYVSFTRNWESVHSRRNWNLPEFSYIPMRKNSTEKCSGIMKSLLCIFTVSL